VRAARDLLGGTSTLPRCSPATTAARSASWTRCCVGAGVPGEVSVIGYDDSRLARLTHINLTTRRPGPEQMARRAVESSNGWKASPACHR